MKNIILLIAILIATKDNAQKQMQIIFNEVPIHFSYDNNLDDFSESPEVLIDKLDRQLYNETLNIKAHHDFIHFIMESVRSGKIAIYNPDLFENFITPEQYFKSPIDAQPVSLSGYESNPLSDSYFIETFDEWTGDFIYDEVTGEPIYETVIEPLYESDFVSFTFVEEWEFDTKNNIMLKKVIGLTANTFRIDETGERRGIIPRFYIKLNPFAKNDGNWKVVSNFIAKSTIAGRPEYEKVDAQQFWWFDNLESSKRYSLVQSLLSGDKDYFEPSPPFNKVISNKSKALYRFEEYEVFDEEYFDFMYDENGNVVTTIDSTLYTYLDIKQLGFIEDWYFDTINFAFGKEIKGIMPYKTDFTEEGEIKGISPIFMVKTNAASINYPINNFELKNHIPNVLLFNNTVENLNIVHNWAKLENNKLNIDTAVDHKIKSDFIDPSVLKNFKTYTRDMEYEFELNQDIKNLLNIEIIVQKIDPEYGEEMYDMETGEPLYDTLLMPYEGNDIIGFRFLENWNYNISGNEFKKDISGTIPIVWHLNEETGDRMGMKELLMKQSEQKQEGEYALIKSNHVYTEDLTGSQTFDYWDYHSNKPWLYSQERKELIEALLEGARAKKSEVIDLFTNKKIKQKDKEVLFEEVNFYDIKSIQFEEDIYFNYTTLDFKKEVKSVTLIKYFDEFFEVYDEKWVKIIFNKK